VIVVAQLAQRSKGFACASEGGPPEARCAER